MKCVTSLSLWKSGLVVPRAAQIPATTEAGTCPERLEHQWRKRAKESLLLQAWMGSEASSCKPAGLSLKDHVWNIGLVPDPTFKEEHFQTQP